MATYGPLTAEAAYDRRGFRP